MERNAVNLHNFSGEEGGETHGRVGCFPGAALAFPAWLCYTDIVNMGEYPIL